MGGERAGREWGDRQTKRYTHREGGGGKRPEGLEELGPGGTLVNGSVSRCRELVWIEPVVLLSELLCLYNHARPFVRGVGEDDLGAEEAHELAALDGEALCHDAHERVALGGADHCKSDACNGIWVKRSRRGS